MNSILIAVIALGGIALVLAVVLYVASRKFAVKEDPRIALISSVLPQANCGGCGYPGCGGFADACVKAGSLEGKLCPVGGQAVMKQVASILGVAVDDSVPLRAVVRCNGSCANRPHLNLYDGALRCAIEASLYEGETGCSYGCLGCGDCVRVCRFGALRMNPDTGLPEVDPALCTACGSCVKACPRHIMELRPVVEKGMVYVSCVNKDKGVLARKECEVSCIGCGKCVKTCPSAAITLADNLAYVHADLCLSCGQCVEACPRGAIQMKN